MDASQNNPINGLNEPMSVGTGDIILAGNATAGKSKKKIIAIVAGIVGVVAIAVLVVLLVMNLNDSLSRRFNIFANYVLYGQSSDRSVDAIYDNNESYAIEEWLSGDNNDNNFEKALTKWQDYKRKYDEDGLNYKSVDSINDAIVYLSEFEKASLPSIEKIVSSGREKGINNAYTELMTEYLGKFNMSESLDSGYYKSLSVFVAILLNYVLVNAEQMDNAGYISVAEDYIGQINDVALGASNDVVKECLELNAEMRNNE